MKSGTQVFSRKLRRSGLKYWVVLFPLLIVWFYLAIYPNISVYVMAFYKYSGFGSEKLYVGWLNFKMVFLQGTWLQYLKNTLLYIGYLLLIQTVLALLLALTLQKNTRHNRFFRAFFFIPMVFSSVMVGLTWSFMFDANLGILNHIFVWLGFEKMAGFNWFGSDNMAILCCVIVHVWAGIGYAITILTAGIHTIPVEIREAGMIDGANGFRIFRNITLPLLAPTLVNLMMLTVATGAMAFDFVLLLGSRMVPVTFDTWSVAIYKNISSTAPQYGTIAVHSALLGIMMMIIVVVQFAIQRKVTKNTQ